MSAFQIIPYQSAEDDILKALGVEYKTIELLETMKRMWCIGKQKVGR